MNPPPPIPPDPQYFIDAEHLKNLSIFHYVLSGITALFSSIPVVHVAMGIMVITNKIPLGGKPGEPDPAIFGWFFVILGAMIILLGWSLAIAIFLTARWIAARKNRTFCVVVAGIECLNMPLGTILGVFTILALQRPSVKALFENDPSNRLDLTDRL